MKKIWEYDFGYAFFRPYIEWAVRNSYSKITVKGLENLPDPKEVSTIITPNHCNTLMDSLVVLQSRKEPMSFVARADIFKNPFFARILHNLRILPIYRRRDCENTQEKNVAIFDAVVDSLNNGMAFSIHPEGTHRTRRSLLPIKKGVFRIAQQAAGSNPDRPVVIIPAGIEYDDYFNLMRPVTLTYGKPISIEGGEDLDELAELLHDRMAELITYFPDDSHLDEAEAAFYASRRPHFSKRHYAAAAALLPIFVLTGFLCSPMLLATALISRKLKDKAWLNTLRFACKLALTPFTVAGAAIAGFIHLSWPLAIAFAVLTAYSHPIFYRILIFYKRLLTFSTL